ncbi:MAG: restriction endonuclease subunit S [Pontiellaceae bacterium]|nr:restriction endonuclease subunit S [Pontiellaceae bacterium]
MKIMDLVDIRIGHAFRTRIEYDPSGNTFVIQPKDISDEGLLQPAEVVKVEMPYLKNEQLLNKGDVLLSSRGRFASTTYENQLSEDTIASSSILVMTVKSGQPVKPEYLSLYFNSDQGNYQFHRLTEQTTIPYLNRSSLEQMEIPIPPLAMQEKLVSLERTKLRYGQLTRRKQQLLNNLINHELSTIE